MNAMMGAFLWTFATVFVVKQALTVVPLWFSCHHAFDEQYGR